MKQMKYLDIFFQKFSYTGILFLCLIFSGTLNAQDSTEKAGKSKAIDVVLKVTDEEGVALSKAQVVVGEGVTHTETDLSGTVTLHALLNDLVTVSLPGYEKGVVTVSKIVANGTVKLHKAKLFMTSDDNVPLPFTTLTKRSLTGSEAVIDGSQLEKYPSTDLRNAFTGLATGLEVIENYGITGMSPEEKFGNFGAKEKVSLLLRGRNPIFIIDDVPTDITEMQLDPQEIESVTVLKDIVAKAMFGPQAADGAIFIKTKRGKKNERILNVNVEKGVSMIDRMPEFVSGADYARLNNQAKINSGLAPGYTDADIAAYSLNNPFDMYHPSINYRDYMLKNTKSFQRANVSSSGGNETVQYFANLAYDGDGDIYKIGSAANFNRISSRANLDIKVNDLISARFDFYGGLTSRQSPNYGYDADYGADNSDDATMDIVEFDRVLGDITSISPIAFPVYAKNDNTMKQPWYGVSSLFKDNPVGRLVQQGYYTETGRSGNIALTLNYDMKNILSGLKSKSYIDFQAENLIRIGKTTDYIAYNVIPALTPAGTDTFNLTLAHNGSDMSGQAKLHDYYYQRLGFYENLNYDKTFGKHAIQSGLTYFISKSTYNGIEEPRRLQNGIWSGTYTYDDKYSVQAVVNYAGTYSFAKGKRYQAFPSIGASWVLSEEKFMSNVKFIDYLKLHADYGKLGYENFTSPYLYNTVYTYNTSGTKFGPAPTGYWFGSSEDKTQYQAYPSRMGNPDLTWETRKEFGVGLNAVMFNHKLEVELNYYNNERDGIITQLSNSVPYVAGVSGAKPYFNYNSIRYFGGELGVQYSDRKGDFKYSVGGSASVQNSEYLKIDQPNYRFSYQSRVGQPVDAYYGQTYLGQFASDEETQLIPQLFDATLHAGDFKYKDMNNDGVIDDNDQSKIGHTSPRLIYSLNAKFSYKGFDLTIIGTGRAFYDIPLTNKYFWNGWGDNTYSAFVRDHNGGAYPKLTYYKVNNNYVGSNFWLASGNFFKVQNVELAYSLAAKQAYALHTRGAQFYVRGANLLTISKLKDVDPENIYSGIDSYPLFVTLTCGVKLTF